MTSFDDDGGEGYHLDARNDRVDVLDGEENQCRTRVVSGCYFAHSGTGIAVEAIRVLMPWTFMVVHCVEMG